LVYYYSKIVNLSGSLNQSNWRDLSDMEWTVKTTLIYWKTDQ